MTCEEALLAISAALDGELPPGERAKLSEHLVQCESCRALAEDLRVLTDALEDSDREPPAELAASVRTAVARETRRKRPPYLRAVAAMLALCVGLGGIGLFVSSQNGKESVSGADRAAPALYQAAPAPSEAMEKSAATDFGGLSDDADRAVGYSATGGSDPAEAPMAAEAPMEAANEEDALPAPSSAPAVTGGAWNSDGTNGAGPSSDGKAEYGAEQEEDASEEKPTLTPEEALELVFQYVGGYDTYPEARQRVVRMDGSDAPAYYLQTVETDTVSSEYCLDYTGLSADGEKYQFHLYEDVTDKADGGGHTATMNWIEVSLDSGEISTMF